MSQQHDDIDTTIQTGTASALVTGASSGIGKAFAELLAKEGFNLVLTSRSETRLREAQVELESKYAIKVKIIPQDLASPDAPSEIFKVLEREGLIVNVLVNNAGFNVYGRFEETDLEEELQMIRLHIIAMTQLTKLFLKQRARDRNNMILNVASVAALVPGPKVSVHFATRAYTLSFSLALADEFHGTDVSVTCLCPGPTISAFFKRASMTDVRLASGNPIKLMHAKKVAAIGYDALTKGKVLVVPGFRNRVLAFMAKIAPLALTSRFTRWIMDRRQLS